MLVNSSGGTEDWSILEYIQAAMSDIELSISPHLIFMEKVKIIAIAPQLIVADVRKTVEFYEDVFGFNILGQIGEPPVYGMVERDGFQVHFAKSDNQDIKNNRFYRSVSHDFIIWVPEIDAFYEELKSKGANIVEGIVRRAYGSREFVVEDCNGRRILVGD